MDDLKLTGRQDRGKINLHEDHEVRYWTRQLNVTRDELLAAVEKVGNSAAAVRKQLAS